MLEIISTITEEFDWAELSSLFASVGWGRRCPERLSSAFHRSHHCCFIYANKTLIGCGRSVDDQEFYSLLVDIIVHPDYQHQGIGSKILTQLTQALDNIPWVILSSEVGSEDFYKKNQFKKMKYGYMLEKNVGQSKYVEC